MESWQIGEELTFDRRNLNPVKKCLLLTIRGLNVRTEIWQKTFAIAMNIWIVIKRISTLFCLGCVAYSLFTHWNAVDTCTSFEIGSLLYVLTPFSMFSIKPRGKTKICLRY